MLVLVVIVELVLVEPTHAPEPQFPTPHSAFVLPHLEETEG
jgi:hypothetical protein